jgi:hypothetical protein
MLRSAVGSLASTPRQGESYGQVLQATRTMMAEHPVVRRFGNTRIDAFISRLARILFNAPAPPTENDAEDLTLLEHLADDVILLTGDHRLIAATDATESFQSPFVRSAWEVLDGRIPDGPPWGASAMEAGLAHQPRTRRSLRALEVEVRRRLGLPD